MLVFSQGENIEFWTTFSLIAMFGNIAAVAALIGGFTLTLKSVNDFTPEEFKDPEIDLEN